MSLPSKRVWNALRLVCLGFVSFVAASLLSGCLVAGFSNGRTDGSLILPGGLGLLVVLGLLLWLCLRQR